MERNYITDLQITDAYSQYLSEQISSRASFLLSPNGTPVSKEYPENESASKFYDKIWKRKPKYNAVHPYMPVIVDLYKKYSQNVSNILEVGAGFGNLAVMLIEAKKPLSYTAYEFSKAYKHIEKLFKNIPMDCETHVYAESFRECSNIEKYDTFIATEIFEHIFWDIEFILKIPKGASLFFSVPTKHGKGHVRAFLLPESVWLRYHDFLDILEIKTVCLHEGIPKWWCVAAKKK